MSSLDPAGTTSGTLPRTTADVRDAVMDAIARQRALRIVGRGTWLDAGRPVRAAEPLSLHALTGIVDYTPGDLTLTARAGTTLAEIAAATAAHGQWLALDAWGGDAGSLGATAATAAAGPMSGVFGTPRDIVLGLETVTGTGDIVRGGGRVVKNVAGFDLTRLMVGAWGTLGVITEVSVRLRAVPERDETFALAAPPALGDLLIRLRGAAIAPLALEIVSPAAARQLAVGEGSIILVRLAGNAESAAAQRDTLASFAPIVPVVPDVWTRLRTMEPPGAAVVRISSAVAGFAETWTAAERIASTGGGFAHASVLRAVTRVVLPPPADGLTSDALDTLTAAARDGRETRIFERLPDALWGRLAPAAVDDRLSRGVRAAFDPHRLLNPGILGESAA